MSQTKAQLLNPTGVFTLTNQLVGVGATFSGDVSIGGTLTKQDVTNVDSVGVITARSDIIVGGNIAHLGDTDTKIAFTNNQIDFQANNSSRLYVNQYATYLQTAYPLAFLSSSGASPSIKSGGTNNQDLLLTTGTDNPTRLHIQSDGKIGIGTNSASALLHIEGTQTGLQIERNAQTLKIDANHGNGGDQALTASSALRIYTNGANERARFDSNGNLGIGSQIPAGKLDISHDTQTNLLVLKRNTGNTGTFSVAIGGATPGIEFSATGVSDDFVLKPGGTERIRLGSSGQIGIAGANYGNAGQVLTSGGSGSIVSWADAAGGGAWALLQSPSNPNTSTVDFVGLTTTYAAYKVVFMGANINSTNQREMRCRIYLNGAIQTGNNYRMLSSFLGVGSNSVGGHGGTSDRIELAGQGAAGRGYNGEITFPMKLRTSGGVESMQAFYGRCVSHDYCNTIGGFHEGSYSNLLTGIRFDSPDNYNVTDGQFYLYGLTRT